MPRASRAAQTLPPVVASALKRLGEGLAIARVRRKESQKDWAQRIGVSIPTLIRMEKGDPTTSVGLYATALWLMGRVAALEDLAAPEHDRGALERDVRAASQRRAARTRASVKVR